MSLSPVIYRKSLARKSKIVAQRSFPPITEPLKSWETKSLETGGFLLSEMAHEPNWVFPHHTHGLTTIGIVLEGFCTEIIGRHSQECAAHSLQLLPAGERHAYKFGRANVRCLSIYVKPQRVEEIRQFSKILDHAIYIREGVLSALVVRLYKEFRMMDNVSALTVEGLMFEMLGAASRHNDRCTSLAQPRWLRQAKDYIHQNATVGVSLVNAATLVGVHPTYLARTFRKFYHCSIGDYIRHVRLDYAIQELTKSDKSLAEIASAAGFYDQSHLTHAFKLHTGITPNEFRIMAQAK